ncbi:MAG: hypothetical protein JWM89_3999 [Acidimicrobiales bacterium]|nr:hypothetical protein [Acidimicrobiales bacterium]
MGATGLFLVALSTPVIDVGPALWGAGLLLFSVLGWSDRRRTAAAVPARRVQRAWVVVVAGVLVVGLVVADVPFRVRWTFSRQEFDAAARRMRSTPSDGWVEVRGGSIAGLPVAEAHRDGRNVWFRYDATSRFAVLDFNNRFFAYLPDGGLGDRAADSLDEGIEVTSLGDGWYYVHDEAD